jgi:MoxR-like ATPase
LTGNCFGALQNSPAPNSVFARRQTSPDFRSRTLARHDPRRRDRSIRQSASARSCRALKRQFVGKDEIVELLGRAVAAEHLLFRPRTAKSAVVHRLGDLLHGQTFEYLLTRFTEPNELFGPFDLRRLREGVLTPNTEGMLPEACIAFLDELFHANSAVLNSLLTALNERVLRRGRECRKLPLITAVGASNQLPRKKLRYLDRFLLRVCSE